MLFRNMGGHFDEVGGAAGIRIGGMAVVARLHEDRTHLFLEEFDRAGGWGDCREEDQQGEGCHRVTPYRESRDD